MPPTDPTFRSHTSHSAHTYQAHRPAYPPALYEYVLAHHARTGGQLGTVVDVGCGTGRATRELARYFGRAVGVDPGEKMLEVAREKGGRTGGEEKREIEYTISEAENVAGALEGMGLEGNVDMVTAATAAHYFDLPRFYAEAARLLKPGGTLVFWAGASVYPHPVKTPQANKIHSILQHLELVDLAPYELPPNRMCRDLYENLPLPWAEAGTVAAAAFPRDHYLRQTFDTPSPPSPTELNLTLTWKPSNIAEEEPEPEPDFFGGSYSVTLKQLGDVLGTSSMVHRWRADAANAKKEDCVWRAMREAARLLGCDGSDRDLEEREIRIGAEGFVLMFKRA